VPRPAVRTAQPSVQQVLWEALLPRVKQLITHLHWVLRLRMTGAVLPLPSYMFIAWAGIILPLHYLLLYPLQYCDLYTELILVYTNHENEIQEASWKMWDKLMLDLTLRHTKDWGYSGDLHLIISTLLCHIIHGILTEGENLLVNTVQCICSPVVIHWKHKHPYQSNAKFWCTGEFEWGVFLTFLYRI
jgi:hypothetical protein